MKNINFPIIEEEYYKLKRAKKRLEKRDKAMSWSRFFLKLIKLKEIKK